ncbi:hypothetical protein GCM10023100_28320 [Actinocorallia cavernae]|uniref:Uncharacterized protein n=2 Tax=Actinomycetes TaxID=1760 RepID=A0ABN3KTH7_9ACTN|nr:hypothetical protein DV517_08070 [Streptomyces sp. S816]
MSTVVLIDLWPSRRETSWIGMTATSAVEAKKCRNEWGSYFGLPSASTSPAATHAFLKWYA